MDIVYRAHRIAIRLRDGAFVARITHVRGTVVPVTARSAADEGEAVCLKRAKLKVDTYLSYLETGELD